MCSLRKSLQRLTLAVRAFPSGADAVTTGSRTSAVNDRNAKSASRFLVFAATLLCSLLSLASPASAQTAMQTYVEAMQPGTNWGNTLDATPDRHSWGAPETTQAMIQGLKGKGYKSLRLPVTWGVSYIGPAPDYAIDPAFMAHVQQVVDWALAADLYVMINMHHDSYWLRELPADAFPKFEAIWTQVASRFKDYPHKLSFESINEPGFHGANGQDLPFDQMQEVLDEMNTTFYEIVRGSGGANATRPLVLPTVYTSADQPRLDALKSYMVTSNDPNLIATVHYYGWYPFSVNLGGYTTFDETSLYWVHTPFDAVHNTFVAAGIPVIVGEFSVLSGGWIQRGEQLKYHEYVQAYGRSKGLTMMLWDTGGIYGRNLLDWANPDLGEIMMQAVVGRAITAESDLLFVKAGTPVQDRVVNVKLNGNTLVSIEDNGAMLTPTMDYTISGDTLILRKHVLAKYATGAYGEKATLKLNANAGPAWKIFVRYFDTPVPGTVAATTGGTFSIPVAFKGDLLATIEAKYADGGNVGGTNWTSFQPFGGDFEPNYANNTITIKESFLRDALPNSIANLAFYFWSGKVVTYQLKVTPRTGTGDGFDFVIYGDSIPDGWHNWNSWMTHDLASTTQVHSGSNSIMITPSGWGGVTLQNGWGEVVDTSAFRTLMFWVHGGHTGGQNIGLHLIFGDDWNSSAWVGLPLLVANTWQKIEIPLSNLNAEGRPNITGISFRHFKGEDGPTFHIDDIKLTTALTTSVMDITSVANLPVSPLSVTRGGFTLNRRTNRMVQTVTVKNTSANIVSGPIYLVLDALSSNTTLANATAVAPTDRPYVQVTAGGLAPQASVAVSLQFTVPPADGITYDARTLSDGNHP